MSDEATRDAVGVLVRAQESIDSILQTVADGPACATLKQVAVYLHEARLLLTTDDEPV